MSEFDEMREAADRLWVEIVKALRLVEMADWVERQLAKHPRLYRWLS